jgi:hypothetical protein
MIERPLSGSKVPKSLTVKGLNGRRCVGVYFNMDKDRPDTIDIWGRQYTPKGRCIAFHVEINPEQAREIAKSLIEKADYLEGKL